jgi:hypothetical protein
MEILKIEMMGKAAEKFDVIIASIERGKSLVDACKQNGLGTVAFYDYIGKEAEAANKYTRACEARAEILFADILTIADDARNDEDNPQATQRARLQIDARKWVLAKMVPKKYGDKMQVDIQQERPIFIGLDLSVKDE